MASRKREFRKTIYSDESEEDEDQLFPYLFVDVSSEDDKEENDDFQLGEGVTTRRQTAKEDENNKNQVRSESPPPKKEKKDLKQRGKKSKPSNVQKVIKVVSKDVPAQHQPRAFSPVAGLSELQPSILTPQQEPRNASPVAGPSGLQSPVATPQLQPRAASPVAGPSGQHAVESVTSPSYSPILESSRLVDTDLFAQETPVFENSDFTMFIQKADHQRQKVIIIVYKATYILDL